MFHRHITRYDFGAIAEVVDLGSREDVIAVTRDLSPDGCFVKTRMPLSPGTDVRIRIRCAGSDFAAIGNVSGSTAEGMEIQFVEISSKDQAILEGWLSITACPNDARDGLRGQVVQLKNRLRRHEQVPLAPSVAPKPDEGPKLLSNELLGRALNLLDSPEESRH